MINEQSVAAVAKASFKGDFCRPLYSSYCFSQVPGTIKNLLGMPSVSRLPLDTTLSKKYDHLILLFVDGFGWHFFEKYAEKFPFLQRMKEKGIVSKITSQFPSTTAAHVTCMNTGLSVGESGVYEWFYYEPLVDRVIAPLLFSFAGDKETETLRHTKVAPQEFYPKQTIYQEFNKKNILPYVILNDSIANSTYSQAMFQGAHCVPYQRVPDAFTHLVSLGSIHQEKSCYFYLYIGDIDSACHRHGIGSSHFDAAMEECWKNAEEILWKGRGHFAPKTACLVVADHGMISIDPKTTCYLNQELPQLESFLKKNAQGKVIVPAGSCRDFFLYVQESHLDTVEKLLREKFQGKALIIRTEELIKEGLFGDKTPSQTFLDRVGNLVILPLNGHSIWWYEKGRFEQNFYAMHGGLTREEIEIPFLFGEF